MAFRVVDWVGRDPIVKFGLGLYLFGP
jgi:hypothetical protein